MREIKLRARMREKTLDYDSMWVYCDAISGMWQNKHGMYYGEIDEETVGESIGRKDKNGVEIYLGDIIEGNLKDSMIRTMGVIAYDAYWSAFGNRNDGGFTMLFKIIDIEVIGNIYENPELAKA